MTSVERHVLDQEDSEGEEQAEAATKTRKKKKNRKKKKAAELDDTAGKPNAVPTKTSAAVAVAPQGDSVTSMTDEQLLRRAGMEWSGERALSTDPMGRTLVQVCRRGYFPEVVRDALNDMWDRDLSYDDPDAVVEHLLLRWGNEAAQAVAQSPPLPSVAGIDAVMATAAAAESAKAATANGHTLQNGHGNSAGKGAIGDKKPAGASGKKGVPTGAAAPTPAPIPAPAAPAAPSAAPVPAPTPPPAPPTLEARLEMAASHSSMTDALSAITAWASVAQPQDGGGLGALFNSDALDLLFANFIAQPARELDVAAPALYGLLDRIMPNLSRSAVGGASPSSLINSGASDVVNHACRAAAALTNLAAVDGGSTRSGAGGSKEGPAIRAVARRLADIVKGHHAAAAGALAAPALLREAEATVAGSAASPPHQAGRPEGVGELFTRREKRRDAALTLERACLIALQGQSTASKGRAGGSGSIVCGAGEAGGADDALLEALLTASAAAAASGDGGGGGSATALTAEDVRRARSDLEAARHQLRAVRAESEARAGPLAAEADALAAHAMELSLRRAALLEEVERVEAAEREARTRSAALAAMAAEARAGAAAAVAASERQHAGLAAALARAAACEEVVHGIEELDASLRALLRNGSGAGGLGGGGGGGADAEAIRRGVAMYLLALESYLASDVDCVALMRRRIDLTEAKVSGTTREMAEYQALGMEAMVAELSLSAAKMRSNADEDKDTILQLLQQAEAAGSALAAVVDSSDGGSSGSSGGVMEWREHAPALAAVLRQLHALGLARDWDWSHVGVVPSMVAAVAAAVPAGGGGTPPHRGALGAPPGFFSSADVRNAPAPAPAPVSQAVPMIVASQPAAPPAGVPAAPAQRPTGAAAAAAAVAALPKIRGGVRVPQFDDANTTMPKLSWARAAPAPKKSLTEIQREEFSVSTAVAEPSAAAVAVPNGVEGLAAAEPMESDGILAGAEG